jgi:hypothetical protein
VLGYLLMPLVLLLVLLACGNVAFLGRWPTLLEGLMARSECLLCVSEWLVRRSEWWVCICECWLVCVSEWWLMRSS